MAVPIVDMSVYGASLALIAGYQLYLHIRLRNDSHYTIQSINKTARKAWVDNIMSDKSRGLLGVQTLRNATMAATFLASTAILMGMGVLNLMSKGADTNVMHALETDLFTNHDFHIVKLIILLATFIWAFFSFSLAVRIYNHTGFLLNSRNDKLSFYLTPGYVSNLLNRGGKYYSIGMRAYYISVPMLFSLHSTWYMLAASIGLVIFLYRMDRTPKDQLPFEVRKIDKDRGESILASEKKNDEAKRTLNEKSSRSTGLDGQSEGNAVVVN
jgi:uncharacterized membrane protein